MTGSAMRTNLVACGVLASLLYAVMIAFVPLLNDDYSAASQTVSELSAIGAPTRAPWIALGLVYSALMAAFGWGVWGAAAGSRSLRVVGALLLVHGASGPFWPPMHLRGVTRTLTDTLHVAFGGVTVLIFLLAIGFGAAAFGRRFRTYSLGTVAIMLVFGLLTGLDGPNIDANLPTPWVGVWQRINIGAFLAWLVVFANQVLCIATPPASPR